LYVERMDVDVSLRARDRDGARISAVGAAVEPHLCVGRAPVHADMPFNNVIAGGRRWIGRIHVGNISAGGQDHFRQESLLVVVLKTQLLAVGQGNESDESPVGATGLNCSYIVVG